MLLPRSEAGFGPTLEALEPRLEARGFEVTTLVYGAESPALPPARERQATYAIAVGSEAAALGAGRLHLPTVYCESTEPVRTSGSPLYGVAALPPPTLQLEAWKRFSPGLSRVALILGPDDAALAAAAKDAADRLSVTLVYRVAHTDQEAAYVFKRLAPEVDGLWLLPDNAVLSPRAIKSMLSEAARSKVQSLVFTPALLAWGGLLSVSSTPEDVAATLTHVVDSLVHSPADVPAMTPLSEVELRVNESAAARLGLHPPAPAWIVRGDGT